jgi:hypothetical protein
MAILTKEMQFRKIMFANMPSAIISPAIGVTLAYYGYGVWAIVAMALATPFFQSIALWIASDWRPSLIFNKQKAEFHFSFGYKLLLSALLDTIFKNIYNIIIGKRYALSSLGQYERANTLNGYPTNILTTIVSKVTYPLLTNIKDNQEVIEIELDQILKKDFPISNTLQPLEHIIYSPFSVYPYITRDIAVWAVDSKTKNDINPKIPKEQILRDMFLNDLGSYDLELMNLLKKIMGN